MKKLPIGPFSQIRSHIYIYIYTHIYTYINIYVSILDTFLIVSVINEIYILKQLPAMIMYSKH